MANILARPSEILAEAKKYFPHAKLVLVPKTEEPFFKGRLRLHQSIPLFEFQNQLVADIFTSRLQGLKDLLKLPFDPLAPPLVLNKQNLFAYKTLSGWQKELFNAYEGTGKKCYEVFLSYLKGEVSVTELFKTGLAPQQMIRSKVFDEYIKKYLTPESESVKASFRDKYVSINLRMQKQELKEIKQSMSASDHYEELIKRMRKDVIGQKPAIERLANVLNAQRTDATSNPVFLFVGPTGVGKTELAKTIGKIKEERVQDVNGSRLITLNMEKYNADFSVTLLFGSPPGYAGASDKTFFIQEIEKRGVEKRIHKEHGEVSVVKDVVVLFDEIEKAAPEVKQSLLTLFREGYCKAFITDKDKNNISTTYLFESSVFVCTSNMFNTDILSCFQAMEDVDTISRKFIELNENELKLGNSKVFSSELIARMTAIIPFGPIERGEEFRSLVQLKCNKCFRELQDPEKGHCHAGAIFRDEREYEQFLSVIEDNHYGQGIDIAKIVSFFGRLKEAVAKSMIPYEKSKDKIKLVFYIEGENLMADILVSHKFSNSYSELQLGELIMVLAK